MNKLIYSGVVYRRVVSVGGLLSGDCRLVKETLIPLMEQGKLAGVLRAMKAAGTLGKVFPEIQALVGVEQSKQYHAEGDVFEHTMRVLEHAKPTVVAQLAALLHDTGKPATQVFEGEKIKFIGHHRVSEEIAEKFLRRFGFESPIIETVCLLVGQHMRPTFAPQWGAKATRRFVKDIGNHLEDLLDLHDSDSAGSLTPEGHPAKTSGPILREKIKSVKEVPERKTPILSGNEIMSILEIPPGPMVGKVTRWLEDEAHSMAVEGMEMTKEEAERLIRKEFISSS